MRLQAQFKEAKEASRALNRLQPQVIDNILLALADEAEASTEAVLEANEKDLERMKSDNPFYDRLKLTEKRIKDIADGIRRVAGLPSPLGHVLKHTVLPNGLDLQKVVVPFGVIGVIYEARPNVSFDVFSLCLKAGSACVLKGGKDAEASNQAIVKVIHRTLDRFHLSKATALLLPATHEAVAELLDARGYVDLLIPRGGAGLIRFVRENAGVPVIETGAGVCHTYFDKAGDLEKGRRIIVNAKTRRVSVCNALDCLLIHADRLPDLPYLVEPLSEKGVILHADGRAFEVLCQHYPQNILQHATQEDEGKEYLAYEILVKTVSSCKEAVDCVYRNGSKHSECIITEDKKTAEAFLKDIDAACVYHNAPTSFTDGGQFGLGAEIGISTQKLHARGPMGLEEITTYKWLIHGNGQIRS